MFSINCLAVGGVELPRAPPLVEEAGSQISDGRATRT